MSQNLATADTNVPGIPQQGGRLEPWLMSIFDFIRSKLIHNNKQCAAIDSEVIAILKYLTYANRPSHFLERLQASGTEECISASCGQATAKESLASGQYPPSLCDQKNVHAALTSLRTRLRELFLVVNRLGEDEFYFDNDAIDEQIHLLRTRLASPEELAHSLQAESRFSADDELGLPTYRSGNTLRSMATSFRGLLRRS